LVSVNGYSLAASDRSVIFTLYTFASLGLVDHATREEFAPEKCRFTGVFGRRTSSMQINLGETNLIEAKFSRNCVRTEREKCRRRTNNSSEL